MKAGRRSKYWMPGTTGSSKSLVDLLSEDAGLFSEVSVLW